MIDEKKLRDKLGSANPIIFMKEAVDEFEKYVGKITGLRHIRPTRIKFAIENLKNLEKEYPDAKVTAFVFFKD